MRLVASDSSVEFIETHGGRLYIWMKKNRCCGGIPRGGEAEHATTLDFIVSAAAG